MAVSTTKNRNTLCRFVSLRSPELVSKEKIKNRFVFHPENDKEINDAIGNFFNAIKTRIANKSKKETLENFCDTFTAVFGGENNLKTFNEPIFNGSNWLFNNKFKVDAVTIFDKVTVIPTLTDVAIVTVWENLFYQTITNKDFYIRENCIQMLVLNNLLMQIKTMSKNDAVLLIYDLANAKVVLPISLFEEEPILNTTIANKQSTKNNENNLVANYSKAIVDADEISKSTLKNDDITTVINHILKVKKKYNKERLTDYTAQEKIHQTLVNEILKKYRKEYNLLLRASCNLPRAENYDPNDFCNTPDIEYPELPELNFDFKSEIQSGYLRDNLSENIYAFLTEIITIEDFETFEEIIDELKNRAATELQKIYSKQTFSRKVNTIAGFPISNQIPQERNGLNKYSICSYRNIELNCYVFKFTIGVPNNSIFITNFNFNVGFADGTVLNEVLLTINPVNNIISVTNILFDALISLARYNSIIDIYGQINLSNGEVISFKQGFFALGSCCYGTANIADNNNNSGNTEAPTNGENFKPSGFGLRQLGIADYKKIVSHVCCYDAGEVAHIENIMAREFKEKTTEKLYMKEQTDFQSQETEKETMSDSTSTERFEMQTEVAKLMREDKQMAAHANFSMKGALWSADIGGSYATNTSKEESNRQAITQGKELTQRAMERIVTRTKNEKTVKVTESFKETNSHIFDNKIGENHVSGVYRFINAIYENKIHNYGKRLMYEFMIPQPSKLHELGMEVSGKNENVATIIEPLDPRKNGYDAYDKITKFNYLTTASKYNVEVKPYPEEELFVGKSFEHYSKEPDIGATKTGEIAVPEGYYSYQANTNVAAMCSIGGWENKILVGIGNICYELQPLRIVPYLPLHDINKYLKAVPIAISITNYHTANITVNVLCKILPETIKTWQKETFDAIVNGYNQLLLEYNQAKTSLQAQGVQLLDSNPMFYRQIEQLVLRKNCISYLIDGTNPASNRRFGQKMYNDNATFTNHQVKMTQEMDNYASFVKFMEQAFDWNLMSYNFYPYYWGNSSEWDTLYQTEINDPLFRSFMQAGMARVVVTVKPGFEDAVMHYMSFGKIWNGGNVPVIGNPLYLSIVDELKEQEYDVEETWETVVPTNLIALQSSGVAINAEGLPCGVECKDAKVNNPFSGSTSKLGLNETLQAPVQK